MKVQIDIEGVAPLILQSDRLANPFDELTREYRTISRKRQKTDGDMEALARMEFYASLYYDPAMGPYMPPDNLHRCLRDAAGLTRKGKDVSRAVLVTERAPLLYDGPRDIDRLWADPNHHFLKTVVNAGQSKGRVVRMRPIFREWGCSMTVELIESQLSFSDLKRVTEDVAGPLFGLGSWRPRYGRFQASVKTI